MKRKTMWVAVALMTVTVMTGCSKDNDSEAVITEEPSPEPEPSSPEDSPRTFVQLTRAEHELVAGSNDFALNLFRLVEKENANEIQPKSLILSPISITYALGMLNNGAVGETRQQICNVLGFVDTGADGINDFCRKMLTEAPALDKQAKVMISNAIFTNKDYQLKPAFVETGKTYYDAELETRDFHDGKTLDVINQWASDHTEKMIEKVLDGESFDPYAVSYLLNAIYFKGTWAAKFDPELTENEHFEHAGSTKELLTLPTMRISSMFQYTENDLCQAIKLPYGNGSYAMTILLPQKGKNVGDVLASLTGDTWQQQYENPAELVVAYLKLPRFETNTSLPLTQLMGELGMPKAFNRQTAEFPDFCNVPTFIQNMTQVARIKLNEEGTEAAAVTTITAGLNSIESTPAPRFVEFYATHPFLYVISEQSTGAIFFIGEFTGYN